MDKMHFTAREKLELMKQIEARNEQRRKEFAEKKAANKAREERLFKMFEEGQITKEEFFKQLNR